VKELQQWLMTWQRHFADEAAGLGFGVLGLGLVGLGLGFWVLVWGISGDSGYSESCRRQKEEEGRNLHEGSHLKPYIFNLQPHASNLQPQTSIPKPTPTSP
jgi:hypothetical protein